MARSRQQRITGFSMWCAVLIAACGAFAVARAESPIKPEEGRPHVSQEKASDVVGRVAYVSGPVVDVEQKGRVTLLRFSQDEGFRGVVYQDSLSNFKQPLKEAYNGKLVCIHGFVSTFREFPQIVITDPSQIEILDAMPEEKFTTPPARAPSDTVRVATYNVLNLFDDVDDIYHQDEGTAAKPREQMEALGKMLRDLDADVIAMEEVENRGYLQRFLEVFAPEMGYTNVVHFEGNDLRGIDVCLISRLPVGPVTSYRHVSFPGVSGEQRTFERDLLCATIEPPGGDSFEVWVVHLKSNYGGRDVAEPIRLAEAQAVRGILDDRLKADPKARIIVCGDFNDVWDSASTKAVIGDGPMAMKCFASEIPEAERISYNREPYRTMIDFILCSPAMAKRYVAGTYRIHGGALASEASDHNPVTASFRVKP